MPNENPPPQSFFAEIEAVIHALNLYGAAGIAAFGWAMGWFAGAPATEPLPLWSCAALLIYNADRLRHDPADALNVPARTAASTRLRTASRVTLVLAALVLVGMPVWRRDWLTLGLVLGGAVVVLGYSIPILGFRWKDVPLLKSLFAPAIITLAVFGLVLRSHVSLPATDFFALFGRLTILVPWALSYLLFNMLLCDLRDHAGDRKCHIRSIPVLWGEWRTRRLLWTLATGGQVLLLMAIRWRDDEAPPMAILAILTGLYQAWLLHATRHPRSERFYEWAVEGLLYLPALACGVAFILAHFAPDDV